MSETMERGCLRTIGPETAGAEDLEIEIAPAVIESFWAAAAVDASLHVRVAALPPAGFCLRRYEGMLVGGTYNGPVVVEKPAGERPFRVNVGDSLTIRVTYGERP